MGDMIKKNCITMFIIIVLFCFLKSEWKGETAGGCLSSKNPNSKFNPQFHILPSSTRQTKAYINLAQQENATRQYLHIGFYVLSKV